MLRPISENAFGGEIHIRSVLASAEHALLHTGGLTFDFLNDFLVAAEFVHVSRVSGFGAFADTSELLFLGQPISLNMEAYKYYK